MDLSVGTQTWEEAAVFSCANIWQETLPARMGLPRRGHSLLNDGSLSGRDQADSSRVGTLGSVAAKVQLRGCRCGELLWKRGPEVEAERAEPPLPPQGLLLAEAIQHRKCPAAFKTWAAAAGQPGSLRAGEAAVSSQAFPYPDGQTLRACCSFD